MPSQPTYAALTATHPVEGFDCGQPARNEWLRRRAFPNEQAGHSRTYVRLVDGEVTAFYSLAMSSVLRGMLPSRLRHGAPDPVPMALLGQLAVSHALHGGGIGTEVLLHAFETAVAGAARIGCALLGVHPAEATVAEWYAARGFTAVKDATPALMLIPLAKVRTILAEWTLRRSQDAIMGSDGASAAMSTAPNRFVAGLRSGERTALMVNDACAVAVKEEDPASYGTRALSGLRDDLGRRAQRRQSTMTFAEGIGRALALHRPDETVAARLLTAWIRNERLGA